MIGDLMSRMADAEKLSVDQLKTALQNGTLPPYIGIPLLQDKVKQTQMMQTAQAGQQPQQPPVAEQVMAQANQVAGVDQLPSNLPTGQEPAYAAGGIVAFAEGDLVDDDEVETEDDRQEASLMALMASARNKIQAGLGRASSNFTSALPKSVQNILPSQKTATTETPTVPAQGGLSGLLNSAATKYGVPSALLGRISSAESSGKANAANPRSSAKGVFQFTDSTWKGMGGKPGEQFNPEANVDLGAKYIRQNAEHLKKTLGRDPNYHEVYAAHMFGPGVSRMLNKANPKDPIERGLSMFQSSDMVKKIMKANPNLRGKSVGEVLDSLQSKTGQGIVALAHGGPVSFADGGYTSFYEENPYDPNEPSIGETFGRMMGSPLERLKNSMMGVGAKTSREIANELAAKTSKAGPTAEDRERQKQMEYQDLIEGPQERDRAERDRAAAAKAASEVTSSGTNVGVGPQAPIEEAVDPYLEKYMSMLQNREAASEKQKDIDIYMSLMQAGLGMMGGSSPYALQNIGAGGAQGLSAYAAAQKQRAAEEAATLSGYGKLYTAKQAADLKRELTASGREEREDRFRREDATRVTNQIATRERQIENQISGTLQKLMGKTFTDATPEQQASLINNAIQKAKSEDKVLKDLYSKSGLAPLEPITGISAQDLVKSAEQRLKDRGIK
jgi:soluble lytic murein transglycosylase-like protein